jgi:hypothetical protein
VSLSTSHASASARPAADDGKDVDGNGMVVPDVAWWHGTMAQDLLTHG